MSAPPPLSATWQQADDLRAQGNFVAARDLLEPAVDVACAQLGLDDPAVVETQRRLATVHREMGELPAARRVLEEALDGGLLGLGDADPLILLISAELGAIADELGNKHEARRNLARVAHYGPTVLGPDHPYVRTSLRYLGVDVPPLRATTTRTEPADAPAAEPARAPRAESTGVPVEPGVYRPAPREQPAPPTDDAAAAQADNTAAQADNTAAQADNTAARADNTAAQADNTAAQADNTAAQADNTAAQADNTAAQADNTAAQADNTAAARAEAPAPAGPGVYRPPAPSGPVDAPVPAARREAGHPEAVPGQGAMPDQGATPEHGAMRGRDTTPDRGAEPGQGPIPGQPDAMPGAIPGQRPAAVPHPAYQGVHDLGAGLSEGAGSSGSAGLSEGAGWGERVGEEGGPVAAQPYDWASPTVGQWAPPPPRSRESGASRRGPLIAMALITLVVVAAGVAIGVVLFHRGTPSVGSPSATASSAPARLAPGRVQLRDDGVSVTLTWSDPTAGQVPFVVAGGRAGETSRALQTLPAGSTAYTLNGLNPTLDYCFTVVAVYTTNEVATSALTCTQRAAHPTATAS